ncbi:MAG: GWxTD domain-containing protein [bacterium]
MKARFDLGLKNLSGAEARGESDQNRHAGCFSLHHRPCRTALLALALTLNGAAAGDRALQRTFSAVAFQNRGEVLESEQQYLAALRAAGQDLFQAEFEAEFLLLLEKDARADYDSLSSWEARKAFVERYWRASNPNPLMPENDWLRDFLQRRAYARKNFPQGEPPFVDDRGKYYLKYGKPSYRYEDFGSLEILPNETWSYENVTRNFIVHFRREGEIYREIENLFLILSGKKIYDPFTEAQVLIAVARQRATVSPVLGRVFARWLDLNDAPLSPNSFSTSHEPLTIARQEPHAFLFAAAQHAKAEITQAQRVAPAAAHDELEARNKVKFRDALAQFRGPQGETRIEIAMLAPLEKNLVKNLAREAKDSLRLEYRGLLRDQNFIPRRDERWCLALPLGLAAAHEFPNAVGKLVLSTAPHNGDLTLQIRNERKEEMGYMRREIVVRDFTGSALMVSDLQLLFEITNEEQKQILPAVRKQDRIVAPYPFDKVRKAFPVLCYFEIYNLRTRDCELTYEIIARKDCASPVEPEPASRPDKNAVAISVTVTRQVTHETLEELLALDLRQLKKGDYCLEVTVADAQNRAIYSRAQKHFVLAN